ncbi:MAG: SemiSWEET transporter [Candidatus Omnitrophica bacterium]|nr:SemiSWEET transporter [Candidatus Omnitrophota bacterium]
MNLSHLEILGIAAGTCTTVSLLPQIIKIIRTKHARDISIGMYILFTAGVILWLIYGLISNQLPIILANIVTGCFCSVVIYFKLSEK